MDVSRDTFGDASGKICLQSVAISAKRIVREHGMATLRLVLLVPSLAAIAAVGLSMLVVLPSGAVDGQAAGNLHAPVSR